MNILVIGNGFDLAHGLQTKYTDFLKWVKDEYNLYIALKINKNKIASAINVSMDWESDTTWPEIIMHDVIKNEFWQKEVWQCISNNQWIDYFLNNSMYLKENWIDFENEIGNVIKSVEEGVRENGFNARIEKISNVYFNNRIFDYHRINKKEIAVGKVKSITYQRFRDILLEDLNRLVRVFEIYLHEVTENADIKKILPDIKKIPINKVLSFNYTDTYRMIYDPKKRAEYDFIHGKLDKRDSIFINNMVLGIDEYLPEDRRNQDVEFIAFKKFYQRIYKQTGCKYKEWVEFIQKDSEKENTWIYDNQDHSKDNFHNLYIFGHSLDITDKDILRDLILNDNVYTTIFYHDKDAMGQQIANLVKVIGQDELIRRTGGSTKTIEFKLQKPMEEINQNDL